MAAVRIKVVCLECGKKFSVNARTLAGADECPKCGGADIDVREYP